MTGTLRSRQPIELVFNDVTADANFSGNQSSAIDCAGKEQLSIYAEWTPSVDGDDLDIQVEFSHNNSDWYIDPVTSAAVATGIITVTDGYYRYDGATASTTYKTKLSVPVADRYLRLSIRRNGTGAGTVKINIVLSGI